MTVNIACQLWLYDTQCLSELNDVNSSFPRKDINLLLDTHTHTTRRLKFPSARYSLHCQYTYWGTKMANQSPIVHMLLQHLCKDTTAHKIMTIHTEIHFKLQNNILTGQHAFVRHKL